MYNNNHDWTFHQTNNTDTNDFMEPLQEPVAFEGILINIGNI